MSPPSGTTFPSFSWSHPCRLIPSPSLSSLSHSKFLLSLYFTYGNAVKQCSKFSKPGFSNTWTVNSLMFKLVLEKAEEPEIKLPTSTGSWKKQESSIKTSISAFLTMPKPLTLWITINWKILQEMGIPDHLTCLLRNLYAGQEATVRTGRGTTDWFHIRRVRQGCILSPYLFNFYAEYIMRNAGLEEAQAGIKIAGRNINNLRYAMTPPLWQKVKRN